MATKSNMEETIQLNTTQKEENVISGAGDKENKSDKPGELFRMKSTDEQGNNCVVYQDPKSEVVPLVVRVGFTLYDMGSFDVAEGTVPCVFDLWLVYDYSIYENTFGTTREGLPFSCPNALELDVTAYGSYMMYGNDLEKLNQWTKRQNVQKNDNLKKFRVEVYTCRGVLKLTTFPSEDPFQSIYVVFKLAMDGTPGSEMTQYLYSAGDCYTPGARGRVADFTKGREATREFRVIADYGEYSRLYFIFEYKKSPFEDLAKYYILPLLINALTIGFYDSVDSLFDSAGAYFLAIIALLFTLPETGAFTRNEKSVVFGAMWMLIILLVLIAEPSVISQIVLGTLLTISYIILVIYDVISSKKINDKYRDVLFEGDLSKLDAI